jgi:hypothetical protein
MADALRGAQQEFWQPPSVLEPALVDHVSGNLPEHLAAACPACHSEFMIGARFCHTCGTRRPSVVVSAPSEVNGAVDSSYGSLQWISEGISRAAEGLAAVQFPAWLRYLHFHEIKRWVGLPTAALIAFIIGLGCVIGAIGVSLFYKASNLGEFQAIQLWRIEWLLAATASFVAGILLKKPSE